MIEKNNVNLNSGELEALTENKLTFLINSYYNSNDNDLSLFIEHGICEDEVTNKYKLCGGEIKNIFQSEYDCKFDYNCVIPVWEGEKVIDCILYNTDSNRTSFLKNGKIFNENYLNSPDDTLFITNNIFDCLSIECLGYKSVCLNGKRVKGIIEKNLISDDESKKLINGFTNYNLGAKINDSLITSKQDLYIYIKNLYEKAVNKYSILKYKEKYIDFIEKNSHVKPIETPWNELNKKLGGGLYTGLYCLGAISSIGKTAFVLQLGDYIAKTQRPVLFFSLEMPKGELMARSISRLAFEDNPDLNRFTSTLSVLKNNIDLKYVNSYFDNHKDLYLKECGFDANMDEIEAYISEYIKLKKVKPVIIIDYLQILKPKKEWETLINAEGQESKREKYLSDKQAIDNVAKALKMMSRNLDITVMVISSFNRASYKTQVDMDCFKESGCIEYTADVLMGFQYTILDKVDDNNKKDNIKQRLFEEKEKSIRAVTLVILKQRNGKAYVKQNFSFYPANNFYREVGNGK